LLPDGFAGEKLAWKHEHSIFQIDAISAMREFEE
jgi:hypothetical protein